MLVNGPMSRSSLNLHLRVQKNHFCRFTKYLHSINARYPTWSEFVKQLSDERSSSKMVRKIIQWPRNRPNWWESRPPRWLLRDTYLHAPLEITVESNGRFRESRNGPQWGKTVVLSDTPICRISRNYHDSERGSGILWWLPEEALFGGCVFHHDLVYEFTSFERI